MTYLRLSPVLSSRSEGELASVVSVKISVTDNVCQ